MPRMPALDGLRGMAAFGVLLYHAHLPGTFWLWSFVDLFLVLSGYLIGSILIGGMQSGTLSVPNFLMRRVLRIWPVYYLTLALVLAMVAVKAHLHPDFVRTGGWLQSLFFLQFTSGYMPGADMEAYAATYLPGFHHSWSIAVEEQFYVILPLLFLLCGVSARRVIMLMCVALAAGMALRGFQFPLNLLGTRLDGLAMGVLLAAVLPSLKPYASVRGPRRNAAIAGILLSALTGVILVAPYVATALETTGRMVGLERVPVLAASLSVPGFALLYSAAVASLVLFPRTGFAWLLSSAPMVWLGSISYALYMFHVPVRTIVGQLLGARAVVSGELMPTAIYFLASILAAYLSRQFLELRLARLKDRFPVYRAPSPAKPGP